MGGRKKHKDRAPKVVVPSALTGTVVRATMGREAGRIFVIVGGSPADERVYIADGSHRRLADPKLKSQKHLTVLGTDKELSGLIDAGGYTDGDIRRAVARANKEETPKGE